MSNAQEQRPEGVVKPPLLGAGMSLQRFILSLTVLIVLVVMVFGAVIYASMQRFLTTLDEGENAQRIAMVKEVIEQRLNIYHDVVQGYARDQTVRDLITFADAGEAIAWSHRVRDSLPQSIGAALFTESGALLGDASTQRIGANCLLDLHRRIDGEANSLIPVHDDIPALAHFDISAPIRDENGEPLGLIFVSFSINELLLVLDRVATERDAMALANLDTGSLIATSPNWHAMQGAKMLTAGIAGSHWQLQLRFKAGAVGSTLTGVGGLVLSGVATVIVLLLLAGRFLTRRYFQVVDNLQCMVGRILAGERLSDQACQGVGNFFPGSQSLRAVMERLGDQHHSLQREMHLDELTGMPNRRAFDRRLDELLKLNRDQPSQGGFCLVLMNLDGLKAVNDAHGHAAGDQVLRGLAFALQSGVRSSDEVSRLGGDEFSALLPQMTVTQMDVWLARVRKAFDEQQAAIEELNGKRCCGVSVGYVYVAPGDGREAANLLHEADQCLYRDKALHGKREAS